MAIAHFADATLKERAASVTIVRRFVVASGENAPPAGMLILSPS